MIRLSVSRGSHKITISILTPDYATTVDIPRLETSHPVIITCSDNTKGSIHKIIVDEFGEDHHIIVDKPSAV